MLTSIQKIPTISWDDAENCSNNLGGQDDAGTIKWKPGFTCKKPVYIEYSLTVNTAAEITDRTTEKYFTAIVTQITELYEFIFVVHSENQTC